MLALEDRADPVALLGSLVSAGDNQRTTVVFDAAGSSSEGVYVAGARVADGLAPDVRRRAGPAARAGLPGPLSLAPQHDVVHELASWVRLRHSTIGTTSPYFPATESPVSQCRRCSGLSHQACRALRRHRLEPVEREVGVVGAGVAEDQQRRLRAERVGVLLGELGERAAVVGPAPQRGVRGRWRRGRPSRRRRPRPA